MNPNAAQSSAPKGQVVQIVSLPDGLQNNARAIRIEGEVTGQNKDGSVRVRTDHGDIDLQVRGRQPQEGAKIEVDIPAGTPPRNATIRPAPAPAPAQPSPQAPTQASTSIPLPQTPVTQQPAAQQPQTTQPAPAEQNSAPQPRPAPVAPASTQPVTTQPPLPQPTTLPPLTTGQIVQIVPLTEGDIAPQLQTAPSPSAPATVSTATPIATIIDKVATQASMAADKVQGGLISNLLQAVKSVLPTAPALATQPLNIAVPPASMLATSSAMTPQTILPSSISGAQPLVLSAKIISIVPPLDQRLFVQSPQPGTPMTQSAGAASQEIVIPTLTATVNETTVQNKPVITLPMNISGAVQNFVMQASSANTPPGTQISLLPQAFSTSQNISLGAPLSPMQQTTAMQTAPAVASTLTPAQVTTLPAGWKPLLPLMQSAPLWPVLDDIFQSFYQATPQAAQILARIIPSPANAQSFGPAVMLFAAALKSGDLQGWLGDKKLEMIQKIGKGDLVSRLSAEASSLSSNNDTAATDWKTYPLPLLYQNEISKVLFHVRREPDDDAQQEQKDATRFVMDVSLPRMGNVQLDALVRSNRVDLVVRTELPVSAPMQDAMRTAYAHALDNTMIYGDIGFQSDVKNFITILGRDAALASA